MRIAVDIRKLAIPVALSALLGGMAYIQAASAPRAEAAGPAMVNITATVAPDPVETLDRVTVATRFSATGEVKEPLAAQLEVQSPGGGSSVLTMDQVGFRVPADGARAVYWEWRVPDSVPAGQYALRMSVVGVDSGQLYGENDNAATLAVSHPQ